MPHIAITIRVGRTDDQVRSLVKGVTAAVSDALDVPTERVRIIVNELAGERIAEGGELVADTRPAP